MDWLKGKTLGGQYELIDYVTKNSERSGQGRVFSAKDLKAEKRVVAVKVLLPEHFEDTIGRERFYQEARLLGELWDPHIDHHIIHILSFCEKEIVNEIELTYFVMNRYENGSLQRKINKDGRIPFKDAISIISQVLKGLEYVHEHGITHRDIKPDNILFNNEGKVLVADFGSAKSEISMGTPNHKRPGTPPYIAPEVVNGEEAKPRSDLYAIGIVLYQMLTGITYVGNASEIDYERLHREIVPEGFALVLSKLLKDKPEERYQSATEVLTALNLYIDTELRIPVVDRRSHQKRKIPLKDAITRVALVILILVVGGSIFAFVRSQQHPSCSANPFPTKDMSSYPLPPTTQEGSDCEQIGLSMGTRFFEPAQANDSYQAQKIQIAKNIASGEGSLALSELQNLTQLTSDSNDAEALIYHEDQRILSSSLPYITVVLGLDFSPSLIGGTHDLLQGAYTEQLQWDTMRRGQTQLLLVLANTGPNSISSDFIEQIAKLPKLVGIIGWENSTDTLNAISALGDKQIPLISPSASDNVITGLHFFRTVPSNMYQASFAVKFATKRWPKVRNAAIIKEDSNATTGNYPIDLAASFKKDLQDPPAVYTFTNSPGTIETALTDALTAKPTPGLIFFAGYAPDLQTLLDDQSKLDPKLRNIPIITGDAASIIKDYHEPLPKGLDHTYFTAFASQDEWSYENDASDPIWTTFVSEYATDFPPGNSSLRIDSDVMLAYDAMNVLLQGFQNCSNSNGSSCSSGQVATALAKLPSYQGVSGQISFGANNSDPVNKAVVIAQVDVAKGQLHTVSVQGCFFVSSCPSNSGN